MTEQAHDSAEDEAKDDPRVGAVVGGRWRVVRSIGRGGMGVVYEGLNTSIGKRVALKFIDTAFASDREVVTRFQREAEAASAVESAHIVEIFDTGVADDGVPYLVMELLRGESLGARVRRVGPMPPNEAVHVVAQTLRGLGRAHQAGVIHRDLKPDNVFLVDRDDDPLFAKILDFGISKITKRPGDVGVGTLTRKGTVLGTPFYMSPEQAQAHDDLDHRSDLFSMGAILYECLTGKAPHAHLTTYEAVIVAICTKDVPDVRDEVPSLPEALAEVTKKALARDRDTRFASAGELLDALRSSLPGVVSSRGAIATPHAPSSAKDAPSSSDPLPPQTKTSWTQRDRALAVAPTISVDTGARAPNKGMKLALLGGSTALAAFAITLLAIRFGSSSTSGPSTPSNDKPPPELSLRVETTIPGATMVIDSVRSPDGLVRGAALSQHTLHVEAEGYTPVDRSFLLDGRTELHIDLAPLVVPTASPSASSAHPKDTSPHGVPAGPKKPVGTSTGAGAGGAPTTPKPPATPGTLQLKVDP